MAMFSSIHVQAEGLSPFTRAICKRLFTLVEPIPPPNAIENLKATVGTLVSGSIRFGGMIGGSMANLESVVFDSLGLNQNLATRLLFYGSAYYAVSTVTSGLKPGKVRLISDKVTTRSRTWYDWVKSRFVAPTLRNGERWDAGMIAESSRAGSVEQPMVARSFQIPVGYMNGAEFIAMGWCVRAHNYIVVPEHVVSAVLAIKPGNEIWVKNNGKSIAVSTKLAEYPEMDLMLIKCTEQEFSVMGLGKISIEHIISETNGETVQIVGLDGRGTTGVLRHSNMFGMVIYDGTTKNGYSGSPYVKGNRVLGVHLCGGKLNQGYSMSYINMLINSIERIVNEDSDDFIEQMIKRRGKKAFKLAGLRHDEVQIRIDGRYHTFQKESIVKTMGEDWLNHIEFEDQAKRKLYKDIGLIRESLGFQTSPGVSTISKQDTVLPQVLGESSIATSNQPTGVSKKELRIQRRIQEGIQKICEERGIKP